MNCPYVFLLFWSFAGAGSLSRLVPIYPEHCRGSVVEEAQSRDEPPLQISSQLADDTTTHSQISFIQPVLKNAPPQLFIFKTGAGPYTELEPEFSELKEFMAERKIAGQLAAVFYDDPAKVPAESLRWEIGVLTNQMQTNSEPFSQKIINGRKVASLVVEGAPGQNAPHYVRLLNFIRQKRFIFRPPVLEIYTPVSAESSKTEIQMPVVQKRRVQ